MFAKNCHSALNGKSPFASIATIFIISLTFLLSGSINFLSAQNAAQRFDPESIVTAKLEQVQKTKEDQIISLTDSEKVYINTQLDGIRARKKVVKRDLKKAQALNYLDSAKELEEELNELVALTNKYYSIIYKANKEN